MSKNSLYLMIFINRANLLHQYYSGIQNEYGKGSPQSKNQKSITGEMIKEICIPIKVDRLGHIIKIGV